jgi:MerR family transcriptional regulator, repressor of the yfmOP operon
MEVITMQSDAFKEIIATLKDIQSQLDRMSTRKARLEEEYLDTMESCKLLKVSRKTLERYRDLNNIPFSKMQRKVFYKISDLEKFLESMGQQNRTSILNS